MFDFYVCSHLRDIRPTILFCFVVLAAAAAAAAAASTVWGRCCFFVGLRD